MKIKCILIIALFFGYQTAQSQDINDLSEEEFQEMTMIVHEMFASMFKEKNYAFKEEAFEVEDFFEEIPEADEVKALLQIIKEKGKLKIEEGDFGPELVFLAEVGEEFSNKLGHIDKIDFEETNLKDEKGQAIPLSGIYQNYSFFEEFKYVARIDKEAYKPSSDFAGTATYHLQFLTGYDQKSLSKKDVGKTITLNNCSFKILEIIRNQIVLEPMCEDYPTVKLINYSSENKVYSSYAWDELMEMQKKDPTINTDGSFTQSSQTIDKSFYNVFKKNPKLSLKKFRKMLSPKEMERLSKQESELLIVEHVAPIGDKFVLFTPTFQLEKVIVKY